MLHNKNEQGSCQAALFRMTSLDYIAHRMNLYTIFELAAHFPPEVILWRGVSGALCRLIKYIPLGIVLREYSWIHESLLGISLAVKIANNHQRSLLRYWML
jgi:hypothetical protein